jgi:hypothetical protein
MIRRGFGPAGFFIDIDGNSGTTAETLGSARFAPKILLSRLEGRDGTRPRAPDEIPLQQPLKRHRFRFEARTTQIALGGILCAAQTSKIATGLRSA